MSKDNNGKIGIVQEFIPLSELLDPNLETISISENKRLVKIYFNEPRRLCFSFENEINTEKRIFIYQNITIEDDYKILVRKYYLLELFFTTPLNYDVRTIKIRDFPIDRSELTEYLEEYNKSYQKRIVPQKEKFSSDNSSLESGVYQINNVRRNHYIPQGYLKKFECESNPGYVYNFKVDGVELDDSSGNNPAKIENIMFLNHFYSLGIELILKNIEDSFYDIRDKIISAGNINWIGVEEKLSIVKYMFAQYIRTPLERKKLEDMYRGVLKKSFLKGDIEIEFELNELYLRLLFERGIFSFLYPSQEEIRRGDLIKFYVENKWKLISAEHMMFYTSDNPIVLYNNIQDREIDKNLIDAIKEPNTKILMTRRPHGLKEPGIQLYFPITPNLCILIYDPQPSQVLLGPVDINKQILLQCYQNILSSKNNIGNFLERNLRGYIRKREKFIELHINTKVEEL